MPHDNTTLLSAEDYIPQIMLLLKINEEANVSLCLEFISICTEHSFLTGIAIGIFYTTRNEDTKNRALSILKAKCHKKLYGTIKQGMQASLDSVEHYTAKYPFIAANPEIDFCGWYYASVSLNDYETHELNLKNIKPDRLTNIEFLNDGHYNKLNIQIEDADADLKMVEILRGYRFKWLTIVVSNDYFPIHLLQFPTIKYVSFKKASDTISIPDLTSIAPNLTHIFNLSFTELRIQNIDNLGHFTHLKSIELRKCSSVNVHFLSKMPLLTRLILSQIPLAAFPIELMKLNNITYLNITDCKLERIDFDFSHLPKIREIHISDDNLAFVTNTFQDCLELRSAYISSKIAGFIPPQSLVDRGFMK
jgi:hypothetical protein